MPNHSDAMSSHFFVRTPLHLPPCGSCFFGLFHEVTIVGKF